MVVWWCVSLVGMDVTVVVIEGGMQQGGRSAYHSTNPTLGLTPGVALAQRMLIATLKTEIESIHFHL